LLKCVKGIALSFANSLLFHYKRHTLNTADSTMNKNRGLLNMNKINQGCWSGTGHKRRSAGAGYFVWSQSQSSD